MMVAEVCVSFFVQYVPDCPRNTPLFLNTNIRPHRNFATAPYPETAHIVRIVFFFCCHASNTGNIIIIIIISIIIIVVVFVIIV